ncbi:MAG TPA: AAA family ATPase [Gemmatimonadaceae bacterium]
MTAATTPSFRLRVLGSPELRDDLGQIPASLGWGKPLALLCYLAIRGEVRRDEIVDLFWRDVEESKARNAFRQALHRLRTALGEELIPHDKDRLRLAPSERLSIDVAEFEQNARAGRLDAAVNAYAGDFLDSSELGEAAFDHWAEQERTRLRARFRQVLQDAVLEASAAGRWADAISRAKRLQSIAPFEPDAAKLAATTLLSAGRRLEALELLRQFAQRTERELGVPVHADVQGLLTRLSREAIADTPTSRPPSARGDVSLPFVGRETELSQLLALWHTVGEDAGALALIEGESGIGKTRLVQEFVAHARSLGVVLVSSGRERAAGAQLPFGVFGEALRPLVHAPGVAGASAHLLAEAARLLPDLRDKLDLPQLSAVEDEASRLRFFEGVAAFIDAAAYEQRILIVLEELQNLPPSSLDLLSYLAARLAGAPVMFVLTLQPIGSAAAVVARLRAFAGGDGSHGHGAHARRLTLEPLSSEQSAQALRDAAEVSGIPSSSVERIARQCAGYPSRLVHALRAASAGEQPPQSPVPMRDVLVDRLQRLSSTQRRVFLVLALLGRPATTQLLASAAHVSEPSCRDAVRVLGQLGFLDETDRGAQIVNDSVAEIAFDVAGGAGRAFLSGWIAEALAREPRAEPAELARLYAAAGNAPQAFEHARRAAFAFLAKGAVAEASQLFALGRTFASSPEQLAEIEGALDALGAGRRRLATGPDVVRRPADENRGFARPEPVAGTPPASEESAWQRLFPNWRILFGAAVATLLISAAVLGVRYRESMALSTRSVDTLVVSEGLQNAPGVRRLAIGNLTDGFTLGPRVDRTLSEPPWVDSLPRQWTNAIPAPRGSRVAISRRTPRGVDLLVISRDRRDSIVLLSDQRGVTALGWSPDGSWLLAARSREAAIGGFDIGLLAFRVDERPTVVAIDTVRGHAIVEALWSPDGSHIAWAARVGRERQMEVFTSLGDGTDVRNVSRSPAEDYHLAWSPDGELLAFTSTRDGNPELYAADLLDNRLWRLTQNEAHDDHAAFSPDGRTLAFESTRRGSFGVYVMPALGGQSLPVGGVGLMEMIGWRGQRSRFVDHVRVDVGDVAIGDSATLRLRAFDDLGDTIRAHKVEWRVLDTAIARLTPDSGAEASSRMIQGVRGGLARVVATVGRWRSDTALVRVGLARVSLLKDELSNVHWRLLGDPVPMRSGERQGHGLLLRAGRDWDSGMLSRGTVPMVPGLTLEATLDAPWSAAPDISTEASMALVAPEESAAIDSAAPQFLRLASISWKGAAGRLAYAVGKEIFTEPIGAVTTGSRHFAIRVDDDTTVSFFVDRTLRWRSTLRLAAPRAETRAQIWIAGRATHDRVRVSAVSVALSARVRATKDE